ncbi:MAG: RidA family protein [Gammaproteobacteria bacterium]|nr:RidA family protein [Gammaproteobacteria bacterium]
MNITTDLKGSTPEERLDELNLKMPPVPEAVADYVTHTQIGSVIYTSGMLPWIGGDLKYTGKMGADLTVEQGYEAFQLSALNGLSLLKSIVGDLSNIKRIHRLEGTGGATPDFVEMPIALNGASHLVNAVFAEKGAHTRMIYSNPSMPINCATLLVFWAEVE